MQLEGKIAIVVGASAEAGTGWAIAESFAAEGAKVIVASRRDEGLKKLAAKIGGDYKTCDVAKQEDVDALVQFTIAKHGKLDIVCNAAGLPNGGTITHTPLDTLDQSMKVNFYGNLYIVKAATAVMKDGGSIILFSSMSVTHPLEFVYSYACAKAATDCLVKYAALEFGGQGIRVNSILPGAIRSEMSSAMWEYEGMEESWAKEVPLGRIGAPADFADAALWLANPNCFATGLNLHIDGGNHITRFPRVSERPVMEGVDPTSGA